MMDDANKAVAKHIESGQYFKDAKDWYASKYLYPYTTRIYALIIAVCVAFFAWEIINVTRQDYISKQYPFPIFAENQVKFYPLIRSISPRKEPLNLSVSRYLVSEYIELREGYKHVNITGDGKEILERKIAALSSRKVNRNYLNYMDANLNPDSPLVRYKRHTQRSIKVLDVEFPRRTRRPDTAKVTYEAIEKSAGGEKKSRWVAQMDFSMSDVGKVFDKEAKMGFTVTRYRTYKL